MGKLPNSLRTEAGERKYAEDKAKGELKALADEPSIVDWKHWRSIQNKYMYDTVLKEHHMLVPRRVFGTFQEVSLVEMVELLSILKDLDQQYDAVVLNTARRRSVPDHFHVHLWNYKEREDMSL